MSDTFKTLLVPMTKQLVQSVHFLTIDSLHTDEGQEKESSFPLQLTPQSIPSGLNCPPFLTTNQLDFNSKTETTEALKSNHSAEAESTKY